VFRLAGERIELVVKATRELLRQSCTRAGDDPWARKW
jgi:hypothetical protein